MTPPGPLFQVSIVWLFLGYRYGSSRLMRYLFPGSLDDDSFDWLRGGGRYPKICAPSVWHAGTTFSPKRNNICFGALYYNVATLDGGVAGAGIYSPLISEPIFDGVG